MTAVLTGVSVFLMVRAVRRPPLVDVVGHYAVEGDLLHPHSERKREIDPALIVGAVAGAMLLPIGLVPGAVIGAVIGRIGSRVRRRSTERSRRRRLGQELATVADLCALYVLSGDSVVAALRRLTVEATGVAAAEITEMLDRVDAGAGFPQAARESARSSAHRDGARLYELLAQAHRSGARLVDSLEMFAADRRAALEREMAIEGGRRALTGYGPILGLMIPTTLLFLMYPTLAGLDALSTPR